MTGTMYVNTHNIQKYTHNIYIYIYIYEVYDTSISSSLTHSSLLTLSSFSHSFPPTDSGKTCKYVKMYAITYTNIHTYVRTSDGTHTKTLTFKNKCGCLRGVMVKAIDCGIVVREFVLQSRYYVHFRANTLGRGMNPLILPAMCKIVPLLFF